MKPNLTVTQGTGLPVSRFPMEFVERKGKGHPDHICDKAAEELSIALSRHYLDAWGRVMHHNVDKCVLAGGQSNARFGGGEVIEPMYLLLVGRAVGVVSNDRNREVPIGKLAVKHTKEWLKRDLRFLDVTTDIIIDYKIRSGSTDLVGNFEENIEIPRANDTSFAVAFAPLTETEQIVLRTEQRLNSDQTKTAHPEIGEDVKVMGVRSNGKLDLIIATAIISTLTPNPSHYEEVKRTVKEIALDEAEKTATRDVSVTVNAADNPSRNLYYLTVTGTSAEHGDDGQVGRGNRANGLITPYRPMTLEATAGKNPVSHVGKTYNIAAQRICDLLIKEEPSVEQATCHMLSEIGRPITEPKAINLEIYTSKPIQTISSTVTSITEQVLEELPKTWRGFLERKYTLF